MSDYTHLTLAKQQINERIEQNRRSHQVPRPHRSRRHALARGLHILADRIDL
jgi:hypothetical protein